MSHYITERLGEIARAMGAKSVTVTHRAGSYSIVPYQTTHNTGGAVMGADPGTSVVNPYLQSWDVSNLFVLGASAFPQQLGYNPTGTIAALAYRCAEAIRTRYLRGHGPLA
jgi:gluconate 2-dehydrogenase alpha chain